MDSPALVPTESAVCHRAAEALATSWESSPVRGLRFAGPAGSQPMAEGDPVGRREIDGPRRQVLQDLGGLSHHRSGASRLCSSRPGRARAVDPG